MSNRKPQQRPDFYDAPFYPVPTAFDPRPQPKVVSWARINGTRTWVAFAARPMEKRHA